MNNVLLTVGAACVVLAVVGGGGKVLGIELPVIQKQKGVRLVALALIGCAFLASAFLTRGQTGVASEAPEVTGYRQAVASACTDLSAHPINIGAALNFEFPSTFPSGSGFPQDGPDPQSFVRSSLSMDRDKVETALRSYFTGAAAVMGQLWQRPIPRKLTSDAQSAHTLSDKYVADANLHIQAMRTELPATLSFPYQGLTAWMNQFSATMSAPEAQLEAALGGLSERPCSISISGSRGT